MSPAGTIVAISSGVGPAARMIVRASGAQALSFARELTCVDPAHAAAEQRTLYFRDLAVPTWVYAFHAPRSSTGEHVVEFHLPGNALLARMLVEELLSLGARPAEAGEFTARAYFNGKLDLTAAEGVAMAVAARSEAELKAARQLLAGELAGRVRPILDAVAETLALVEVGIDFVDEDVTFLSHSDVAQRVSTAVDAIDDLRKGATRFEGLAHEPTVVLVGRPNAGKSTLLNALAGRERAVVSDVAGTTRDVVSAQVSLRRGFVRVLDVAGLDATSDVPDTPLAQVRNQMQRHAFNAIATADVVAYIRAVDDVDGPLSIERPADVFVRTKSDLKPTNGTCYSESEPGTVHVSAIDARGLDEFRRLLDEHCFDPAERATFTLNARHLTHLDAAASALARAVAANDAAVGAEVTAMELREAVDQLGAIVGSISPDDLLGRVFSQFCIGK